MKDFSSTQVGLLVMIKRLLITLAALCCALGLFAQADDDLCGHNDSLANPFGQQILASAIPDYSGISDSDGCNDNGLLTGGAPRVPKIIRLKFHVVQDQLGERNFPENIAPGVFMDVINRANEKLGDNQPASAYYGDYPPPVLDINIAYEYAGVEYYKSANWPQPVGGLSGWNDDPNALNVHLTEYTNNWVPQPAEIRLGFTTNPSSCGGSNGSIQVIGVDPNENITVYYRHNGGSLSMQTVPADASGTATISGLAAGAYSDIHVDYHGQRTRSLSTSLQDPGSPVISLNTASAPFSCGGSDGGIVLDIVGASGPVTVHYTANGVSQTSAQTPLGSFIFIPNLPAGAYSDVYVETANGCISNAIDVDIVDAGAPVISLGDVDFGQCNGGEGGQGSFDIEGLSDGVAYTLHLRTNASGTFTTSSVTASGTSMNVSQSGGYYEAYVSVNGCISNTVRLRLGENCRPSATGGNSGGNKFMNIFKRYHRYQFRTIPIQQPVIGDPYHVMDPYLEFLDDFSGTIIHEMGHKLGLWVHVFGNDGCDDTPNTPQCHQSNGYFGTNNFMDWNCGPTKRAFTPCQIERMHGALDGGYWPDVSYTCTDPLHISSLQSIMDYSNGQITFWNDYFGPISPTIQTFFTIEPLNGSGAEYYSDMSYLSFNMMLFEGQSFKVCANTQTEDGCLGIKNCDIISVPMMDECVNNGVTGIDVLTDLNGIVTGLDPQSLASSPHLWTYSSQNGTTLSNTCVHQPDVDYSEAAFYLGDELEVCVEVMDNPLTGPCTTEVCTTIIIPPAMPECPDSKVPDFIYYPIRVDQAPHSGHYALVLEAPDLDPAIYTHKWVIEDKSSGATFMEEGPMVTLTASDIAMSTSRLDADLRVCHIAIHILDECIAGKNCQDIQPNCIEPSSFGPAYGQISNLSFDPATEILSYSFDLPTGPFQDISYVLDGFVSAPTNVTSTVTGIGIQTYTVSYQLTSSCGTASVALATVFENNSGFRYCKHDEAQLQFGNHPCDQGGPGGPGDDGGHGGKGRKEGKTADIAGLAIQLVPNPTDAGYSLLAIEAQTQDNLTIVLIDMKGRTVRMQNSHIQVGKNHIRLDVSTLSSGLYIVQVRGKTTRHLKLEVL